MPSPVDELSQPTAALAIDANGDGRITLADASSWLAHLFFFPGDWTLWAVAKYAPPLASLLSDGAPAYGGFVSGFIATVFWVLVLAVLGTGYAYVVDFDRRATRASVRLLDEVRRVLRVAARLLRFRFRRAEPRDAGGDLDFSTQVDLDALETRVLRELANLAPGYASAPREIAQVLHLRADQARVPLEALVQRRLAIRTLGGSEGESGYALSAAGRAVLLMRQLAPRSADPRSVDDGSHRA
jgi:hypothetical protein